MHTKRQRKCPSIHALQPDSQQPIIILMPENVDFIQKNHYICPHIKTTPYQYNYEIHFIIMHSAALCRNRLCR